MPVTAFAGEHLVSRQRIQMCKPRLWSAEHPDLYTCSVRVVCNDAVLDEDKTVFGIRRLELSAQTGLKVNGQEVKLRGACIHPDNGILGAAAYKDADEVELFLNGNSCGKKSVKGTYETVYDLPYQPGCLMAVAYTDGRETGCFCLDTAKDSVELEARTDKAELSAARRELAFITVVLKDGEGQENLFQKKRVSVHVEGAAELLGFGNADPQAMESYDDTEWETYDGQVMAVIRAGREPGMAKVVFSAEDCKDQTIEIEVKE